MKKLQGFTLVELVIVIVVLGLLSAAALPRFINVTQNARVASVNGMAGGISSAATVAKAQYVINGIATAATITMDGQSIDIVTGNGRPDATAAGIELALQGVNGFNVTHGGPPAVSTFRPTNGGGVNCQVTYTESTGAVVVDVSVC